MLRAAAAGLYQLRWTAEILDEMERNLVMRNDPKDRHVAAAAVKTGAQVIVTSNLKDFASLPEGLEAQSPDLRASGERHPPGRSVK